MLAGLHAPPQEAPPLPPSAGPAGAQGAFLLPPHSDRDTPRSLLPLQVTGSQFPGVGGGGVWGHPFAHRRGVLAAFCCCVMNGHQTYCLKTIRIYVLTVHQDREFGSDLAGWFCLRVFCEGCSHDVSQGYCHLKVGRALKGPALCWGVTVGGRPQFLSAWASRGLLECPHSVAVGFLRAKD